MIVFLDGKFVPEEQAVVSVFDRSFLYGDGLFETMLIANGMPFRWNQHLERLQRGAAILRLSVPFDSNRLGEFAKELINHNRLGNGLLRLTLSRGIGVRGYSPRGAERPRIVMTLHPAQPLKSDAMESWKLHTASTLLPANQPLAQLKHCNKLPQILARAEAEDAGADEALLRNTDGYVVEGSTSNLFWVNHGSVCTPPLVSGILSGVTRLVVLELCPSLGLAVQEQNLTTAGLRQAEGVFLSLSTLGIVQGVSLDDKALGHSSVTRHLHAAYVAAIQRETGG